MLFIVNYDHRFSLCFRNEVWRYQQWPGFGKSFTTVLTRGLKYAAIAMVATIAIDKAFGISKKAHGHDEHH